MYTYARVCLFGLCYSARVGATLPLVCSCGLIMRVPRESSNRCTSRRLCHKHVFVMQAGLPHRTRRRPLIIHLAPKTSTDQLPIRPATQNRPKAACAPPTSPLPRLARSASAAHPAVTSPRSTTIVTSSLRAPISPLSW